MADYQVKALDLLDYLRSEKPFASNGWAYNLLETCKATGAIDELKKFMTATTSPNADVEAFKNYANGNDSCKANLKSLVLGSLGKTFVAGDDKLGFKSATNPDRVGPMVSETLRLLLPQALETHIDEQLRSQYEEWEEKEKKGQNPFNTEPKIRLPRLREMAQDEKMVKAFNEQLLSKEFGKTLQEVERENKSEASGNFRLGVIFVHEYFRCKGMVTLTPDAAMDLEKGGILSVLDTWLDKTVAPSEGKTYNAVIKEMMASSNPQSVPNNVVAFRDGLAHLLSPATIAYFPDSPTDSPMVNPAAFVLKQLFPEWQGRDLSHYQSLGPLPETVKDFALNFTKDWENVRAALTAAVQESFSPRGEETHPFKWFFYVNNFPAKYEEHETGAAVARELDRLAYTDSGAFAPLDYNARTLYHFKGVMDKATYFANPFQKQRLPPGARTYTAPLPEAPRNNDSGGCFVAGTMVWTDQGQRAIETLGEGDMILTRALKGEYGVKSDETVAMPIQQGHLTLFGFNDEPVFFTRNHVFHTTTGLRALDPVAAKEENPWLDVGNLRVGHTLLRSTDGKTYESVTIDYINWEDVPCNFVWGIHLREGLRSYHANGYLVHLNYPEITIKSIADSIKRLPKQQALHMLATIKELKPIFQRFGGGTVDQLLARELADDNNLRMMKHKLPDELPPQPLFFQTRSYSATSDDIDLAPEGYRLPFIDALDGVLYVDNEPCTRSRIMERGLAWSRQLDTGLWEHGMATFGSDRALLSADGLIWVLPDANPEHSETKPIRFKLQSVALRPRYVADDDVGPLAEPQFSHMQRTMETAEETTEDTVGFLDDWMSGDSDPDTVFSSKEAVAEKNKMVETVEGALPRAPKDVAVRVDETFIVKYDAAPFETNVRPNVDQDLFIITRELVGDAADVKTCRYRIPDLDRLATERQTKLRLPQPIKYYESSFIFTKENSSEALITILNPEAIALAADDNVVFNEDGSETIKSFRNLTFKKSNCSFILPTVFSKLQFRPDTLRGSLRGKLTEYEPDYEKATEEEGLRHLLIGKAVQATPSPSTTAQGSTSGAAPAQPGAPAGITSSDETLRIKSQVNLISNMGVDSGDLKKDAQDYLYKAMLYHMDDSDRDNLTESSKPSVSTDPNVVEALPADMADALDSDLKNWLKSTYSVAYLANTLSQQSDDLQKKLNAVFTAKDKKRLEYWWHGKGANCLSRSSQYSRLNAMATMISFRRRVPKIMQYIYDIEKADVTDEEGKTIQQVNQGKKWAYLYYHQVTREDYIHGIAESLRYTDFTKLNSLEYHCTVMNALWVDPRGTMDGGKLGKKLAGIVNRYVKDNQMFRYSLIDPPETTEDGLRDYFGAFIDVLLDEKKSKEMGINPSVRAKILNDLQRQGQLQADKMATFNKSQKENMIKGAASAIRSMAGVPDGATKTVAYGRKGLAKILSVFRRQKAPPVDVAPAAGGASGVSTKVKVTAGAAFALTLVAASTAYYVYASWDSWGQIGEMNALDRAKLVTGGLQAVGGFVYGAWKSVQAWKGLDTMAEMEHSVADSLQGAVRKRANAMDPKLAEAFKNPGVRQRANAMVVQKMSANAAKPANLSEALLSSKKPSIMSRLKASFKSGTSKFKLRFNATETTFRSLAIAISSVMLVLACISAAQNWDKMDDTEKWLTVLGLIVQLVAIALEIIILFVAISPLWAIGIAIIGLVISIFLSKHQAEKNKPKEAPATIFYKEKARPFLDKLDDPAALTFDWTVESSQLKVNQDTTLVIKGAPTANQTGNLHSIRVTFTSGLDMGSVLFNSDRTFGDKEPDKPLAMDQVGISYPANKISPDVADSGVVDASIAGSNTRQWGVAIELKDMGWLKQKFGGADKIPFIKIAPGEGEIRIEIRGVVAKMGDKPAEAKTESGKIPPWAKYTLTIQESYAGDEGVTSEVREKLIDIEKVG